MRRAYPILLIAWLAPSAARANLLQVLQSAFSNQCIPRHAEHCAAPHRATWQSSGMAGNNCECPCADMYYDAGERRCLECAYGSVGSFATSCIEPACPDGTAWTDIGSGCPAGFQMVAKPARKCAEGLDVDSITCPAGFYRYVY